jgi:TPR repeat protein
MHRLLLACLVLALLSGCAVPSPSASRTEYDLGVDAFRSKNYASARLHWSRAAEGRDASAASNLGFLLHRGLGGEPDQVRAVSLWTRAAKSGHPEAQRHLGHAYETGQGTARNLGEAYAWYRCSIASAQAAPADDEAAPLVAQDARKALASLLPKLPVEQLAASELLARQYIASYATAAPL